MKKKTLPLKRLPSLYNSPRSLLPNPRAAASQSQKSVLSFNPYQPLLPSPAVARKTAASSLSLHLCAACSPLIISRPAPHTNPLSSSYGLPQVCPLPTTHSETSTSLTTACNTLCSAAFNLCNPAAGPRPPSNSSIFPSFSSPILLPRSSTCPHAGSCNLRLTDGAAPLRTCCPTCLWLQTPLRFSLVPPQHKPTTSLTCPATALLLSLAASLAVAARAQQRPLPHALCKTGRTTLPLRAPAIFSSSSSLSPFTLPSRQQRDRCYHTHSLFQSH